MLVVGESKGVTQASNYIQKIIDQATVDKEAATIAAGIYKHQMIIYIFLFYFNIFNSTEYYFHHVIDSWAEHEGEKEEEGEEEWMKAYIKKSNSGTNNSADGGKFIYIIFIICNIYTLSYFSN